LTQPAVDRRRTAPPALENVPGCLRERPQWIVWRYEEHQGRELKVPYAPRTGCRASSTNPETWAAFAEAAEVYAAGNYDGVGYVFTKEDPFAGIDLDDCLGSDGTVAEWARQIVDTFGTYTEISPSGQGLKLFLRGKKPAFADCTKKGFGPAGTGKVEVFDDKRYFTLTGHVPPGSPSDVQDCQEALDALCRRLWPPKGDGSASHAAASRDRQIPGTDEDRTSRCLGVMRRMHMEDHNDGSKRLLAAACRCVEHDLTDAQAVACIRAYAAERPFPTAWSDGDILKRLRSAEERCVRGDALGHVQVTDDGTEPLPLDDPSPPAMPTDVLDGWLGVMAREIAEATETPLELAALLCLSAVATAAQGRFSVRPEPGYFEPVNLWTAPAMKSGQRKTAVHKLATRPLVDWERVRCRETADERQAVESKVKTLQARAAKLRAQCAGEDDPRERDRLQEEIEELEASMPRIPVAPRLFTQDVTPEHLGTMMAEQGERMALLSDEGGIFDVLAGRYSGGIPNLDLFLQAHSGAPVRVDRGSRPSVVLDHPLLTMGLSPQPDVLRALSTKPGFRGRGLLARFLYALPRSRMGYRDLDPRQVPDGVAARYAEGLHRLLEILPREDAEAGMVHPHVLSLDGGAYGIWKEHQRRVEVELRETGRFAGMTDWAGKLPGAVARMAGLMHCARWALEPGNPVDRLVDRGTMQQAVRLGELLAEHALAVFDLMTDGGGLEAARKVWRHIQDRQVTRFTFSELWHPLRGTFRTTADIEPAVEVLLDHRLLLPVEEWPQGKSGRRGRRYVVNPKALEGVGA
jgi:hypothetical protein